MFTVIELFRINLFIANIGRYRLVMCWYVMALIFAMIVLNAISLAIYTLGIMNYYL